MPISTVFGRDPSAFLFDTDAQTIILRKSCDDADLAVWLIIREEHVIGSMRATSAHAHGLDGSLRAMGAAEIAKRALLRGPGGNVISLEQVSINQAPVAIVSSEPMTAGHPYDVITSGATCAPFIIDPPVLWHSLETLACLCAGVMISTDRGGVPVEWLRQGDRIMTRDCGFQPLVWTGHLRVPASQIARMPGLHPVSIAPDTFGPDCPRCPVTLSGNHKVLLAHGSLELHFGHPAMFSTAADLVDDFDIVPVTAEDDVKYFCLLLAQHQAILADGLWIESMQAGAEELEPMPAAMRDAVLPLVDPRGHSRSAYPCLSALETSLVKRKMPDRRKGRAA